MRKFRHDKQYSDVEDVIDNHYSWAYYVWGEVQAVHRVGDYAIIEYVINRGDDIGKVRFHPAIWTDKYKQHHGNKFYWDDTNNSYLSLESALVGVIAYRFDGANSQAAGYFCKMIGLN